MTLKNLLSIALLATAPVATAQTELSADSIAAATLPADTLLNAATAGSIEISSARKSTNITVEGLNHTNDNFYYQSKSERRHMRFTTTNVICDDVKNIVVVNYEDRVSVDFTGDDGASQNYTFYFETPGDRQYKSFVGQNGSDFGFTLARKGKVQWDLVSNGLTFGWGTTINDSPDMNVSMWKSNEISWTNILAVRVSRGHHAVSLGVGFLWQNYVTKGNRFFNLNMENRSIGFTPYPEGATDLRSRIQLKTWQMPLLYTFSFGHRNYCNFVAGPILCFNTGSSIKTQYKLDGNEYSIVTKNIGQRPVTLDLFAGFNYRYIGVFVRYSPMKKLRDRTQLPFNTISTGLSLAF